MMTPNLVDDKDWLLVGLPSCPFRMRGQIL
jgi:hypothetical protein